MTIDFASRRALLALARQTITEAVGASLQPPQSGDDELPVLDQRRGAFVTLTRAKRLRGCIGRIEPDSPLRTLIPSVARSAALEDPRFGAVTRHELPELTIEISLLGTPEALSNWERLEIGVHGLFVRAGWQRGLLLPQVAVQFGWTPEEFLREVCSKAGLEPDAWQDSTTVVQTFRADVFSEEIGDDRD